MNKKPCEQVSDDEILAANETYGSLGELAIMALPKSQVLHIFIIWFIILRCLHLVEGFFCIIIKHFPKVQSK